jgi:hypothetical protein
MKGMSIKQSYRKEGINPEDIDYQEVGMDLESIGKTMLVRPKHNMCAPTTQARKQRVLLHVFATL